MTAEIESRDVERAGWRFEFPSQGRSLTVVESERLIATVLETISGARGKPFRRSRYATTYRLVLEQKIDESRIDTVFLKVLDAQSGPLRLVKRMLRGASAAHLVDISEKLCAGGILAPRVLLAGYERRTGRELVAIEGLRGRTLAHNLRIRSAMELSTKRTFLQDLGRDVGRFHSLGYIHGDLTPYNVIVTSLSPPQFGFIDHERTRRRRVFVVGRHRMRNLVQLGRFDLAGLSRTDRVRTLAAYADAMHIDRRRALRRVNRMLQARLRRDRSRGLTSREGSARVAVGEQSVGGN